MLVGRVKKSCPTNGVEPMADTRVRSCDSEREGITEQILCFIRSECYTLVGPAGLEPATNGLKGRCSTD